MTESEEKSFWGKALEKVRSLFGKDEIYDFDGDDSVLRSLLKASHARAIRDVNIAESYNAMKDFVARYNGDADKEKDEANGTKVVDSSEGKKMSIIGDRIEGVFNSAVAGNLTGKSVPVGKLSDKGRAFLESISGLNMKKDVDFVLNPSDLVHIYNNHFGENEKDSGSNVPLTREDIRNIVNVINKPTKVLYLDGEEGKCFAFLKDSDNGTYNLLEIYADRRGNLTAKTYYKTKKDASHRAMILLRESQNSTPEANGAILSDANIPELFEIPIESGSTFQKENSAIGNTTDTGETISGKRNDTATPQNTVSADKVTNSQEENNTLLSKIDNVDRAIASVTGRDVNEVHTERARHELAKNQEFVNLAKEDFKYSRVNANQQIFVSNARRAVESLNMGKANGEQWLKAIQGKGGLKAGEDKWLGLSDWLTEQKKSVTKEDLLKYIDENRIRIEEAKYFENPGDEDADPMEIDEYNSERAPEDQKLINRTRLNYTTWTLDNKREIALTVPTIEPWNQNDQIHFGDAGGGRAIAWIRFGDTDDGRILVIDEIQSKRHQEGREKGYDEMGNPGAFEKQHRGIVHAFNDLVEKYGKEFSDEYDWAAGGGGPFDIGLIKIDTDEPAPTKYDEEFWSLQNKYEAENIYPEYGPIPDAPFRKNWHELAMKRMLRLAAEEGYDKVAWTSGDMQADRYDLSRTIRTIKSRTLKNGNKEIDMTFTEGYVEGDGLAFEVSADGIVVQGSYEGNKLSDVIGKELAEKLLNEDVTLDGKNLRIGGEGMRGFYDEILPRFMDKYGKKWGVKTQDIELPVADYKWHSVDVTQEMKESVMEGQLMFSKTTNYDYTNYPLGKVADNLNSETVTVVPGGEMHEFNLKQKTADLKKEVFKYIDSNNVGVYGSAQLRDGRRVQIFKSAVSEAIDNAAKDEKYEQESINALMKIKDILSESIEGEVHPDFIKINGERKPENGYNPDVLIHRVYGATKINGIVYRVKTTIKEDIRREGDGSVYTLEVQKIEIISGKRDGAKAESPAEITSISSAKLLKGVEKSYDPGKYLLQESIDANASVADDDVSDETLRDLATKFSKVTDPELIRKLDSEPVEEWYGSMTWLNPEETDKSKWKFAPVKSAKDSKGQLREASSIGQWEQSEEDLEGLKNGKYDLKDVDNDVVGGVNYNPYFHVSNSLMNDQFTGAYNKPNTVVVKFLVPKSELYPEGEAYHAEGAKNHVGVLPWHSGIINAKLPADKRRSVALTRWRKPDGIATDEEVAKFIAGKLKEANASMPWNLVTPGVLAELDKIGAPISEGAGSAKMKGVPRPDIKFSRYSSDMLREIASGISEEDYNKFSMDVFYTDEEARKSIINLAREKSWDFLGATKQFLSSLAEDSESADNHRNIYDKLRSLFGKDDIYDFDGDDSVLRNLLKASHARAIRDVNIAESYNAMKNFVARYNGDADNPAPETLAAVARGMLFYKGETTFPVYGGKIRTSVAQSS